MANRHTLHFKYLEPFKNWLIENDWEIKPLSNSKYEVLRAKRDYEWVILYKKDEEKEHYSFSDRVSVWVNKWIRETQIRQDERAKVVEEISKNVAVETINGKRYARFNDLERILDQVERREK